MNPPARHAAAAFPSAPASARATPSPLGRRACCCVVVLLWLAAGLAWADGGHIALRATSGPYSITLFTAPEPLVSGPVDLSLLVEDAASGEVLEDATAAGSLTPAGGEAIRFPLTREAASNKLLFAATPVFKAPGSYALLLRVQRPGARPASFSVNFTVAADHRRRTTLIFALIVPFAAILLFLINQQAKLRRRPGLPALH